MEASKKLYTERDAIFDTLTNAWSELELVRSKWIENPLNQGLAEQLKELQRKASKLEERFSNVNQRLYGSWVGIDE